MAPHDGECRLHYVFWAHRTGIGPAAGKSCRARFFLTATVLLLCRELTIALLSSRHTAQHPRQSCKAAERIHASVPAAIWFGGFAAPCHIRPALSSRPLHPPSSLYPPRLPHIVLSLPSIALPVSFLIARLEAASFSPICSSSDERPPSPLSCGG